jgi:creatinine amidohydrolase
MSTLQFGGDKISSRQWEVGMLRWALGILAMGVASVCFAQGQTKVTAKWEELTAEEFQQAEHAVQQEYAVIFPEYYFGQIAEARHEPGTVAYNAEMQMKLLQATTDEMGRNGCKKVVIVNGHGGNESFLPYFAQSQLDTPHDYVVYVQWGHEATKKAGAEKNGPDWHAGETETSNMLVTHPNLTHMDRANNESGADQKRVKLPENLYTGIWWYARFPNHYSGDGSTATRQQGEEDLQAWINTVVRAIRAVKADEESLKLQNEFYEKSRKPMETVH